MKKNILDYFSFLSFTILILLTSCNNNPLNKKYDVKTIEQDGKNIEESKILSKEDETILLIYILNSRGNELEGKTYSEILQMAKDYESEQKQIVLKAKKNEEERIARLGKNLTVVIYNKKWYIKENGQNYSQFEVSFENKEGKDIKTIKGSITIDNEFNVNIGIKPSIVLGIDLDTIIHGKQIIKLAFTTDNNKFIDENEKLKSKEIKVSNVIWIPEKITYIDGTILE